MFMQSKPTFPSCFILRSSHAYKRARLDFTGWRTRRIPRHAWTFDKSNAKLKLWPHGSNNQRRARSLANTSAHSQPGQLAHMQPRQCQCCIHSSVIQSANPSKTTTCSTTCGTTSHTIQHDQITAQFRLYVLDPESAYWIRDLCIETQSKHIIRRHMEKL